MLNILNQKNKAGHQKRKPRKRCGITTCGKLTALEDMVNVINQHDVELLICPECANSSEEE